MKKIIEWVKNNPNRTMFLVPILLVAGISISHVVSWYNIANPLSWAIYLSIAIEVGAMTALVAATNKIKGGVWFMFGLVTLIQMIGNIFFSYKEVDSNGELFKSWVELTGPVWEMVGSDPTDVPAMKRWLAFLEGGLLPIISLTSLHFFVKYDGKKDEETETTPQVPTNYPPSNDQVTTKNRPSNDEVIDEKNVEKLIDLQQEAKKVWDNVSKLRDGGKLPPPLTEEELLEEPTALAFTPYEIEEDLDTTEEKLISDVLEEANEIVEETEEELISDGSEEIIEETEEELSNQNEDGENIIIEEENTDIQRENTKRLSYTNRNAGSFRINRI